MSKTNNHITGDRNAPVTLYQGCTGNGQPKGYATISQILALIRSDKNAEFKAFSLELKRLAETDPAAYKAVKEKSCPAFIIGHFADRKNESCEQYTPLLGFDIDHTGSEFEVEQTIQYLSRDPHVFAAYASPSGNGLRFLVWCDSSPETHKKYYQAVAEYFSHMWNIPTDKALRKEWSGADPAEINSRLKTTEHIDTSTNNLARLWFYTWVPEDCFYLNPHSQVFYIKTSEKKTGTPAVADPPTITDGRKIEICLEKVKRQNLPGGRNNFVYALACELARHGVPEALALGECYRHQENGFGEAEIKKSVASAYQTKSREFSDKQIARYLSMTEGANTAHRLPVDQVRTDPAKGDQVKPDQVPADQDGGKGKAPTDQEAGDLANRPKFIRIRALLKRRYDFRMNMVALEIEYSKKGANSYQVLNENDLICELLEAGFSGVEAPLIALLKSSFVPQYDPFHEYFTKLPTWKEGDTDHITHLANFISARDQHWFNLQFKKMLVRLVACALNVIPFNKQCFILKGEQNDGKSTFIRFLCPPKLAHYITDHININNKDGLVTLCQNLIINLDELSQFQKQDVKKIKSIITLDHVKERLPYDRKPTRVRRRASFFGSTNDDEFLVDETGNVRWLVLEIKRHGVNHDKGGPNGYTAVNIDLVYAQAYALLQSGFDFELTKEEIAKSERNNQGYQVVTVEQELIQERFVPSSEDQEGAEFVTATEIMQTIESEIKTTIHLRNVGRALSILGFEKKQKFLKEHNAQRRGYWVKRLQKDGE